MLDDLKLQDFIELSLKVKEIRHSTEYVDSEAMHIFCYMISTPELFINPLERECRGIVFDNNGVCVCRPFHKFWNIAEREETLPQNINWNNIGPITLKYDGSLLTPVIINKKIFWKTKKSFYSSVAQEVQKKWDSGSLICKKTAADIIARYNEGFTPLFEYIAPDNRIVCEYNKEELIYLGERNTINGNYYMNPDIFEGMWWKKDYKSFIEEVKEKIDIEGYVLYTTDRKEAYKIKTQWYLDRHHLLSSLSYKEIFRMIVAETIDDILSELRLKNFSNQVNLIESLIKEYTNEFNSLRHSVIKTYALIVDGKTLSKKEFALVVLKEYPEMSSLLFLYFDDNSDKWFDYLHKTVSTALIEKYKGKVLFMGEEQ